MREIYKRTTNNNGMCLVRPVELLASLPYSEEINLEDIAPILQGLAYDEYFQLEETEKQGEYYFCISLQKKGFAFLRAEEQRIRNRKNSIFTKLALAALGALAAWFLKWLIELIVKSTH